MGTLSLILTQLKGLGLYILGILKSLGINETVWPLMGLFLIALLALSKFVFKPYIAALTEREGRTSGGETEADELLLQAKELQTEYENRAKELNREMRTIYDEIKAKALIEQEGLLHTAHHNFEESVKLSKSKVETEYRNAQEALSLEVPSLSRDIVDKLVGRA